jgi:RNA polymerase sigma-70 factor (ECF subfamily)
MTDLPAGADKTGRQALFDQAVAAYGPAVRRLTLAYEAVADRRADLLQEIYLALWQSLESFDGRCALGTWVYRVAHNTATTVCIRRRDRALLVSIDDIEISAEAVNVGRAIDEERGRTRMLALIHRLKPLDRQIVLLYLEDLDAAAIGEVVGLSAGNIATKIHRLKKLLAQQFHERSRHD